MTDALRQAAAALQMNRQRPSRALPDLLPDGLEPAVYSAAFERAAGGAVIPSPVGPVRLVPRLVTGRDAVRRAEAASDPDEVWLIDERYLFLRCSGLDEVAVGFNSARAQIADTPRRAQAQARGVLVYVRG